MSDTPEMPQISPQDQFAAVYQLALKEFQDTTGLQVASQRVEPCWLTSDGTHGRFRHQGIWVLFVEPNAQQIPMEALQQAFVPQEQPEQGKDNE